VLQGVTLLLLVPWCERAPNPQLHQESRMHAPSFLAGPHDPRIWILAAIVVAVLGLMAVIWDPTDLGDGLVQGSDGSVSTAWESARGGLDDFLFGSSSSVRPVEASR
jgi:hypothetical protein